MCEVVSRNDIDLYVLTLPDFSDAFNDCSRIFPLSNDYLEMVNNLTGIVDSICE